jgi:chromate reductase
MVVSCSPGGIGGFGSNHHLRQCLVFLQMPVMQMEAYVGGVNKLVNEQGQLTNDDTKGFLTKIMQDFGSWIAATAVKA